MPPCPIETNASTLCGQQKPPQKQPITNHGTRTLTASEQLRPLFVFQPMKQLYAKLLLLALCAAAALPTRAYDCEVDGIYYNLDA